MSLTSWKQKTKKKTKKQSKKKPPLSKEEIEAPKSFIITRGKVTESCKKLRTDLRSVFSPYTAKKLEEKKNNTLTDFIKSAPSFGITHLLTLTQAEHVGTMLRVIRLPNGPTFWFKIKSYSLINDIQNMHKNSNKQKLHYQFSLRFPPFVILNGFSKDSDNEIYKDLTASMLKHLFVPMNIAKMKLNHCKRVVLFNYNKKNNTIDFRHYKIIIDGSGVNKKLKKLEKLSNAKGDTPNLSKLNDISELLINDVKINSVQTSDTENELLNNNISNKVKLTQPVSGIFNEVGELSSVKLKEIGPRMKLGLWKIEELVNTGRVLYHRIIKKTEKEILELEKKKEKDFELKKQRKLEQELNVQKKKELLKQKKNKKMEKKKEKQVDNILKKFEKKSDDKTQEQKKGKKRKFNDTKSNKKPVGKPKKRFKKQ